MIQRSLVPGVRDTQCGFKAFTAEAARDLFRAARIDGWAFDLEILALARRRGFAIAEVGVEWTDDNRSRVNPIKDMWKVVREAMTIRRTSGRRLQPGLAGAPESVACAGSFVGEGEVIAGAARKCQRGRKVRASQGRVLVNGQSR